MAKILTIFYSFKGETIGSGPSIVNLEKGYTAMVAETVQKTVGGDIFEIETFKTYLKDHMEMIEEAKEELDEDIYPEIKGYVDISDYDVIFLGYPNWWNHLPMPVKGFLKYYDWSGKKIFPFVTSGGDGFGKSLEDLEKICRGAEILDGGNFLGQIVEKSEQKIIEWAESALKSI